MNETGGRDSLIDAGQEIKLLIVDDEEEFLDAIARRLSRRGFLVATASDGEKAKALARQEHFDLALVDLIMPGLSGQVLLQDLKQEHQLIEVIILTGHATPESIEACAQAGAYKYLQKPICHDELAQTLREAYTVRMEKQLVTDEAVLKSIVEAAVDSCPYGILRRLRKLDDGGK
jgi:DNA-binding NtrC family response regulator